MPDYVILFGAGASKGSDNVGTPPLGEKLFDALVSFNKSGWGQIPPDLAKNFRKDFEEGMKIFSKSYSKIMPPLQRAMAVYFFNFYPSSANLYRKLAHQIKKTKWNGALISINYERLLERSLIEEGLQPIVGDLRNINQIEFCLPHGCCHIFCEGVHGRNRGISFKQGGRLSFKSGGGVFFKSNGSIDLSGPNITTQGEIKIIGNPDEFQNRIRNDSFPPVMSYFEPQKRTTSGVNFIDPQRRRYEELVSMASTVGIVGVKVRPNDTHIWDPLAKTSAKLIYCSGRESGQEFDSWREKRRPGNQDVNLGGYFAECFGKLCKELNLS